jgi:hypothetical protein
MRSRRLCTEWPSGLLALLCVALASCGATGFDKPSVVKGVRILAVQKEPAYPHPGETVNLTMLFWDGKRSQTGRSPVQVLWIGGDANGWNCINPKGDLYYGCFGPSVPTTPVADAAVADTGDAHAAVDAAVADTSDADAAIDAAVSLDAAPAGGPELDSGLLPARAIADHLSTHHADIPGADIILKPIPPARGPRYGLEYVFFAACAGRIGLAPAGASSNMLPIGCFGPGGEQLGPDDFVPGYTSIYVYADLLNANPIVSNLLLDGIPIGSPAGPTASRPHLPRCTSGKSVDCPAHTIKVDIDRASAEADPTAISNNRQLGEQVWVAFYTTAGEFKSEVRLVNDAEQGWNADNGTEWRVPTEPGPVRLWGIVHDNRGGVAWTEGEVIVE